MRILLLTNKNTDNQSDVINALGKNMNIFVNHGPIGLDYIKKNKISKSKKGLAYKTNYMNQTNIPCSSSSNHYNMIQKN